MLVPSNIVKNGLGHSLMVLKNGYEIIEVAGENLVIPVGESSKSLNGVIAINEAAAFLLKELKMPKSIDELVCVLTANFDVERNIAERDIHDFIEKLSGLGIIGE